MPVVLPSDDARHLVERVDQPPPGVRARRWVLRDDNQQHYHGVVRLSEIPVYVELRWKPGTIAREQRVGLFRLHLPELLAGDYVRYEREDSGGDEVRLRFFRGEHGVVYIQARADRPALAVGTVSLAD